MRRTILCFIALSLAALVASPLVGADKPEPETAAGVKPAAGLTPAPAEPEGMVKLFNGRDLSGWEGHPNLWSFKDGVVRGESTKEHPAPGNTFLIWRGGELKDFDLRLGFRIKGGNSGVQYRCQHVEPNNPKNKWIIRGYQAEVEDTPGKVGFLYDEGGRGYLCNVGEKAVFETGEKKPKVVGAVGDKEAIAKTYRKSDWNDYVIIAKGNTVKHYLNGVQTIEFTDNDEKNRELSGLLALQIHSGPPMVVEFKDVRIKHLGDGATGAAK
jgi:Domain of Unknown Function (DUF1080)